MRGKIRDPSIQQIFHRGEQAGAAWQRVHEAFLLELTHPQPQRKIGQTQAQPSCNDRGKWYCASQAVQTILCSQKLMHRHGAHAFHDLRHERITGLQ